MKTCWDCGDLYDPVIETNCPAWSIPMKHSDRCPGDIEDLDIVDHKLEQLMLRF